MAVVLQSVGAVCRAAFRRPYMYARKVNTAKPRFCEPSSASVWYCHVSGSASQGRAAQRLVVSVGTRQAAHQRHSEFLPLRNSLA